MIHLWTKKNNFGSKLIRWGLDTESSHYAVCFDLGPDLIFQSRVMQGVFIMPKYAFFEKNDVVFALKHKEPLDERFLFRRICRELYGSDYDIPAYSYFGYRAFLEKIFDIPLPSQNIWQREDDYLCTGVARFYKEKMNEIFRINWPIDIEMLKPDDLYGIMSCSPALKKIDKGDI